MGTPVLYFGLTRSCPLPCRVAVSKWQYFHKIRATGLRFAGTLACEMHDADARHEARGPTRRGKLKKLLLIQDIYVSLAIGGAYPPSVASFHPR